MKTEKGGATPLILSSWFCCRLMRLRNAPWEVPEDPSWSSQPSETKRVWMTMFKKDDASGGGQLINGAAEGQVVFFSLLANTK